MKTVGGEFFIGLHQIIPEGFVSKPVPLISLFLIDPGHIHGTFLLAAKGLDHNDPPFVFLAFQARTSQKFELVTPDAKAFF